MAEGFPGNDRQDGYANQTAFDTLVDWEGGRKASGSIANGACVVVAHGEGVVGFQDSKRPEDRLAVGVEAAALFLADVKAGVYDL